MGGKSRLVKTIVPIIEGTPHVCYCEPFCGAAWIMFGKDPETSKCEVINDADNELVSFFRVVQRHYIPFIDMYRHAVVSRKIFEWLKMSRPETLTDMERAARYYYLQRMCFGGKVRGRTFGYSATEAPRLDIESIGADILAVHHRLARVTIEHLDGLDCIKRYDRPGTLFFIDPPYHKCAEYEARFPEERYAELAAALRALKGKFLLTINDHPFIRETFKGFSIGTTNTKYTIQGAAKQENVRELLICNFDKTKGAS